MNSHKRSLAPFIALSVFAALPLACAAVAGPVDDPVLAESDAAVSTCGLTLAKNKADGDYCADVLVKNGGSSAVKGVRIELDVPSGAKVDWAWGATYTQQGSHVTFTLKAGSLGAGQSTSITFCNSQTAKLAARNVHLAGNCGITSPPGTTTTPPPGTTTTPPPGTTTTPPPGTTTTPPPGTTTAPPSGGTQPPSLTPLGKYVVTWYSFQDNTPVNSALTASGRPLIPYVSVAIPFRLLTQFGGKFNYGDRLYVEFLAGRTMPNGKKHTGWVQIDDFCGDSGDDSYCFQSVGGGKYPNVDLYIGDFTVSGMNGSTCSGPAGSGQELTNVSTGSPGSAWTADYGGKTLGSGRCGDYTTAKAQHGSCWDYTPPQSSVADCAGCEAFSCTSR